MKRMSNVLIFVFFAISFISCNTEVKKPAQDKEFLTYYSSGEVLEKKIVKSTTYEIYEYFDKSGASILKYEYSPKIHYISKFISEGLSNKKSFKDDEEKVEMNKLNVKVMTSDSVYYKNVKYEHAWIGFESTLGYSIDIPLYPQTKEQNLGPDVTVTESTVDYNTFTYNIGYFQSTKVNDDASFKKFYKEITNHNSLLTLVKEKPIEVAGIKGIYREVKAEMPTLKIYSKIAYIPVNKDIISVKIVGKEDFVSDEIFEKFVKSLTLKKQQ